MTKPASRRLNRRWRPNGIDVIGRGVGRRSPPGRINSLESMSPPAGSLTPWRGISGELAPNAPNYMSRTHGCAAADHAIVNEKAAHITIKQADWHMADMRAEA